MSEEIKPISTATLIKRTFSMAVVSLFFAFLAKWAGYNGEQQLSVGVFFMIIMATLMFWQFRLAIAFLGIAILLGGRVLSIESLILSSQLDIILFLIGMMIIVGVLKDLGLFTWIIQSVIGMKQMSGRFFISVLMVLAALLSCVVDEVTSIVFITALLSQVCDTLKIRAIPFVMIAVFATNVGSTGTMLGNPVGILIGYKAGFTFMDFIRWAFPVMLASLFAAILVLLYWYRKEISEMDIRLAERRKQGLGLGSQVNVPYQKGLMILIALMVLIGLHHTIEVALGLEKNTVLIASPLVMAGLLMIWKRDKAQYYVEREVEWATLIFFMLLFAVAGTLEHTGVTEKMATDFSMVFGDNKEEMVPFILGLSAIGSAFMDNVVFVAALVPVIRELDMVQLWWALLFGACFGGNITMIGSTANIVALGMMEKRYKESVRFGQWFKIGALVGLVTCLVAWAALVAMGPKMTVLLHPH